MENPAITIPIQFLCVLCKQTGFKGLFGCGENCLQYKILNCGQISPPYLKFFAFSPNANKPQLSKEYLFSGRNVITFTTTQLPIRKFREPTQQLKNPKKNQSDPENEKHTEIRKIMRSG